MRAAAASRAPRRPPRGPATAAAASSPRASAAARRRRGGRRRRTRSPWMAGGRGRAGGGRAGGGRVAGRRAAGFRAGFGGAGSASSLSEDDDGRVRRAAGRAAAAAPRRLALGRRRRCGRLARCRPVRCRPRRSRLSGLALGRRRRRGRRADRRGRPRGRARGARRRRAAVSRRARPARRAARRATGAGRAAPLRRGRLLEALEALPLLRRAARPLAGPSCARSAAGTRSIVRADGRPDVKGAVVVRGDDRPGRPRGCGPATCPAATTKSPTRNAVAGGAAAPRPSQARRPARPHGRVARPATRCGRAALAPPPAPRGGAAAARGFRRGRTVGAGAGASGCRAARQSADVGVGRELSFVASPPRRSCETRSNSSRPGWMASWRSWPLVMSLTMNGTRHSGHTYSSTVSSRRHAAQNAWPQGSISRSSWSRRSSQRRHVNAASSPAKFSVSPGSIFFPLAVRLRSSQGCMRRKKVYIARVRRRMELQRVR